MLPVVEGKAVHVVSSCYIEMHFKNHSYLHGSIKFYNPCIWSFIFNETDVLLMLCCECADSETAIAMVSCVCVRAENLLRMCYITSFSLVTSLRLFQFLNVPFFNYFFPKVSCIILPACLHCIIPVHLLTLKNRGWGDLTQSFRK